ncbi:MAG: SPOR domain-containing protein [Pseudomonadota bacterium]
MKEQDHEEKKLFDELEALYSQVAKSEKSEAEDEQREALQNYYQSLRVSSDASLETIKEVYEQLVNFWGPGQFADNPSVREKAETKLGEITQAYEKILAFRQKESGLGPAEPPDKAPEQVDLITPIEETISPFRWGRIILGGAVFVVAVLAIFFWPTFYHYDTIPSGNQTYQVKTNRITGSMTYFNGEKWNTPPIPAAQPSAPPPLPAPAPPAQPPTLSAKQPIPATAAKPGSVEGPKVASKKETPSEKQSSQPAETKGYAIQVSAMRDLNIAKEFVETQKKSGQQVYLAKTKVKDQRVWYRVYIGRFADKAEAARYMKEKKIKEIFPGCFIKKIS